MFVLQSCPGYATALNAYAPPLFTIGLIGLIGGAVDGRHLVKRSATRTPDTESPSHATGSQRDMHSYNGHQPATHYSNH
jgi:hypothetical protein